MKKVTKLSGLVGALALGSSILFTPHADAAVASYPYNGLSDSNYNHAMNLKSSTQKPSVSLVKNPKSAGYEAVGRVSNLDGWKGQNKDSMGTGFIVDAHTYITNLHVVQDDKGKIARPQDVKMVTERYGSSHKYTFNATSIKRVPNADAVVVHTRQDMSKYVTPLKLASESSINKLRTNDPLKAPGYDKYNKNGPTDDNTRMWESKGRFLTSTSNNREIMMRQIFRSGGSGSPILTNDNKLVGIMAYGWNLNGTTGNDLSGGFKFTGDTRQFIKDNMK